MENFIYSSIYHFLLRGVIKIANKDFNSDLDNYIKGRRFNDTRGVSLSKRFDFKKVNEWTVFSLFRNKKEKKQFDEDYDDEHHDVKEFEIDSGEELDNELGERRKGFLTTFFKKRRVSKKFKAKEEKDDFDAVDVVESDLEEAKEVIKIAHKWLEELPPESIYRFKKSDDFQKYKSILKKLGMIK